MILASGDDASTTCMKGFYASRDCIKSNKTEKSGYMPKYEVWGRVVGSKYIGSYEASTEEEAIANALEDGDAYVSVCHSCVGEVNEAVVDELSAEKIEE